MIGKGALPNWIPTGNIIFSQRGILWRMLYRNHYDKVIKMKGIFAVCVIFSIIFLGCELVETRNEETAQELADRGMAQFNKGNYRASIQTLIKLRDWYPFSEQAVTAELKIADALYNLSRYEDAIHAYGVFENLHAGNEAIPYVVNQVGLCYYNRVGNIDRDQTPAEKAMATFQRLLKQYPDSIYAARAKEYIRECKKRLSGHELEIGLYYFNKKNYKAALHRFNAILTQYPDIGEVHHQAMQYATLCEQFLSTQSSERK